jgi:hypothetical protein
VINKKEPEPKFVISAPALEGNIISDPRLSAPVPQHWYEVFITIFSCIFHLLKKLINNEVSPVPEEYAGVLNEQGHLLHSKGPVTRSATLFFVKMLILRANLFFATVFLYMLVVQFIQNIYSEAEKVCNDNQGNNYGYARYSKMSSTSMCEKKI